MRVDHCSNLFVNKCLAIDLGVGQERLFGFACGHEVRHSECCLAMGAPQSQNKLRGEKMWDAE